MSVSKAKEKNLTNKAQYLIECNFKSDTPRTKFSSDVSYIKCKDGTLYLSNEHAIVNTDQGAVYFAYEYVELAEKMCFTRSMPHRGRC